MIIYSTLGFIFGIIILLIARKFSNKFFKYLAGIFLFIFFGFIASIILSGEMMKSANRQYRLLREIGIYVPREQFVQEKINKWNGTIYSSEIVGIITAAIYYRKKRSKTKVCPDPLSQSILGTLFQAEPSKQADDLVLRALKDLNRGHYEKTFDAIAKAIEIDPNCFRAYNVRGIAYSEIKKYPEALCDYRMAMQLNPRDSRPYFNRAVIYKKLGDHQQTIKEMKEAARLGDEEAREWLVKKKEKW